MKPLVFLLYDNRSGSTFLSALLNRYRDVSVSIEIDIVYQVLEYPKKLRSNDDLKQFIDYLFKNTRFPELNIDQQTIEEYFSHYNSPLSQKEVLDGFLELYYDRIDPQAECWVVKGPRIYYNIKALLQFYPDSKFIQIVRDGRAVYNSKKSTSSIQYKNGVHIHRGSMDDNLVHAAHDWHKVLIIANRFEKYIFNVRYEDLIQKQDETLNQILDYLDISKENRIQTKSQETFATRIEVAYHTIHPSISSSPQIGYIEKWKKILKPELVYIYEKINHSDLERFGYEIMELNNRHNLIFYVKVFFYLIYYWFNSLLKKFLTAFQSIFVTHNFITKIRSKLHEFN